jgi:hypothetical protein
LLVFVLLALAPFRATAWGNEGHTIICDIAFARLSPAGKGLFDEARSFASEIEDPFADCQACQPNHPLDSRSMSFRSSCIWPDEARRDTFKGTYEYHFINVPKGSPFDFARDCRAFDCALVAIQRYARYLAEPAGGSREKERKALALRFLGHFVGDMHQPLHVGHVEDLGGNRIAVKWFGLTAGGMNLHKVWDSAILRKAEITTMADAEQLNGEITPAELAEWQTFDIVAWARESDELANQIAYVKLDGSEVVDGDDLRTDYFERAKPVAIKRLKQAGVRLAHLINAAADGSLPRDLIDQ